MRVVLAWAPLFILLMACGAESAEMPCSTSGDCVTGEMCVDGECVLRSVPDAAPDTSSCEDRDGDGYGDGDGCLGLDCNDDDVDARPGAPELCNGLDDDCDANTDEEMGELSCGEGVCAEAVAACIDGVPGVCTPGTPSPELCNDVDDDCDGAVDEGIDDPFDDAELRPRWVNGAVGGMLTYTIADSFIRFADAPFVATPSRAGSSWVYEPDVDLGNQIRLARSVGEDDFDFIVDLDYASTNSELTLGGVGLTNAANQFELMLGYTDGSGVTTGAPRVRVRLEGDDLRFNAPTSNMGAITMRATRTDGMLFVYFDGMEVLATPFTADIQAISLFAVRHRNTSRSYVFGSIGVDRVRICH